MTEYFPTTDGHFKGSSNRGLLIVILAGAVLIATGLAIGLGIGLRSNDNECIAITNPQTNNSTQYRSGYGKYRFAAVVADASLCSQIGTKIMGRYRGNAVDAAVATVICGGVVQAQSTGIGGGALIVYYNRKNREAITIDSRETAPGAAKETMFADSNLSTIGGLSIGVPGELSGLWALHEKYGSLPWADLLQPTIDLCINGAPLTQVMHTSVLKAKKFIVNITEFDYLFDDKKNVLPVGSLIKRPKLARTLKTIADEGIKAFYNGSLTADIIADIRDANGIITEEDLQSYRPHIADPISFNLTSLGLTVHSMPPPGSGAIFEFILNILQGYNFSSQSISTTEGAVLTYHRIMEAIQFAYAKRSHLGDSRFVNVSELLADLTSPEVGEETRAMINDSTTQSTEYYGASFDVVKDHGTSHFSIMDSEGNAVAITSTVNMLFGSKVKGTRTGIIFNDEMDDFSTPKTTNFFGIPASPVNFIVPGKRPMSSMCPSIIVDSHSGEVKLVIGGSGGSKITTTVAMIAVKTLWLNKTLINAIDDPRLHHQLIPSYIEAETHFPQEILDGLKRKGYKFVITEKIAVATAINNNDKLEAVSDWRKGGAPDGF